MNCSPMMSIGETITAIREDVVNDAIDGFIAPMSVEEQWDVPGLEKQLESEFGLTLPLAQWLDEDDTPARRNLAHADRERGAVSL